MPGASPVQTAQFRPGPGGQPPAPQQRPPGPPSPPPQQMQPGQGGGFGPQGPMLDLQSIIQAVTRAAPGAPPQVIAKSVNQFIPLMNAQSQQQWKEMSLALREQGLLQSGYYKDVAAGQRQEGLEERERHQRETEEAAQQRIEQGEKRVEQGQQKIDEAARHNVAMEMRWKWEHDDRLKRLQQQLNDAEKRGDLATQRTILTALHQASADAINEAALRNGLTGKMLRDILEKNRSYFRDIIDKLSKPGASSAGPAAAPEIPE